MILLADSGSTKCDWVLLDNFGTIVLETSTLGLNPAVISSEEIKSIIENNADLHAIFNEVQHLDFFGAGCGTITPKQNLTQVLEGLFKQAHVNVYEDTMAAVLSVTQDPAIVCILGTGSNSCYFDGDKTHMAMESLGYTIMDKASGNYFGKQLIRDYYYKTMPKTLAIQFEKDFNLDADYIKLNLYKKPHPNAYLASFAKFMFSYPDQEAYFYNLLHRGINEFIKYHILCYPNAKKVPIHFIGSIAYFAKNIIVESFKNHNLQLGTILQKPMEGLITYYKNHHL